MTMISNRKRKSTEEDTEGGHVAFQEAMEKIHKIFQASMCDQAIQGKHQPENPRVGTLYEPDELKMFKQACYHFMIKWLVTT